MLDRHVSAFFIALGVMILASLLIYSSRAERKGQAPHAVVQEGEQKKRVEKTPDGLFSIPLDDDHPIRIGILGPSAMETEPQGYDAGRIEHLLSVLKSNFVQAIFITGDVVAGKDSEGKYNPDIFRKQLESFNRLQKEVFKVPVPIFPVITKEDVISERAHEIIRQFNLDKSLRLKSGFVYGVNIGRAFFSAVSQTYALENIPKGNNPEELIWLQNTLAKASERYRFLFTMGPTPVFPITPLLLNESAPKNDMLWDILVKNHALAYFASQDNLFDRSNHLGVWQIVSGGSEVLRPREEPFYHCLLITIPPGDHPAKVEVLNEFGKAVDEFELVPDQRPLLYQLHIK